jgi:hypothetical protein
MMLENITKSFLFFNVMNNPDSFKKNRAFYGKTAANARYFWECDPRKRGIIVTL